MPFDAPMAEPAPTRRSSRTSATPVQASSETLGASRAELRRRAAGLTVEQPTIAWGPQNDEKRKDASDDVAVAPLTDLPAAPTAVEIPAPAAPAEPAPLSRRARRALTGEQPIVDSAATAEFELVEPLVEVVETPVVLEADEASIVLEVVEAPVQLEVVEEPVAAEAVIETPTPAPSRRQRAARRPFVETPLETETPAPMADEVSAPAEEAAGPAAAEDAASIDEFEAAARLFSFTGEFAVPTVEDRTETTAATDDDDSPADPAAHAAPLKPRKTRQPRVSRGTAFKRVATASFSVGVMGIVGIMAVGMTTPSQAVAAASGVDASLMAPVASEGAPTTDLSPDEIQAYVAPSTVEAETLDRSGSYDTTTVAELASQAGISNFSNLFHNDPNSAIQWPFVVGVTMSYGYGMRDGKLHKGIDFTPGSGAPIQAIADGTVRVASEAGGDYGVHVIIDHEIDGQLISSHYAHMQYGSMKVVPGQKVTVGTVLGNTGNTGRSYGAHTHFELLMNGTVPIDPMPWLREHAGG